MTTNKPSVSKMKELNEECAALRKDCIRLTEEVERLKSALKRIRHLGEYGSVANRQEIITITTAALEEEK